MADDKANKGKSSLLFYAGLAITGVATCAAGVGVGFWLTNSGDEVATEPGSGNGEIQPIENEVTAALSDSPPFENVNPQADGVETVDGVPSDDLIAPEALSDIPNPSDVDADSDLAAFAADEFDASVDDLSTSSPLANHIAMADEELRAGNFAKAIRAYQFSLEHVRGAGKASVLYRLALCSEAAGKYHEAVERYQHLMRSHSTTSWATVARLGEARSLAALGEVDAISTGVLRPVLLDETVFSAAVRAELLHVCGRGYCQAFLPEGSRHLLEDSGMIVPDWTMDPNRQLDELPRLLKSVPPERQPTAFEVLQQTDVLPHSTYVKAFTTVSDVQSLLDAVCTRSGFDFEITPSAEAAVNGRTQRLYADDINLSLLLDGLCVPFGLLWWHDDGHIHVASTAEVEHAAILAFRREAGIRLLQQALVLGPDSHHAGFSRVSLGVLQFQHRSAVEAAYTFQSQMEIEPRSEVEAEASFNLGKCYLATGQLSRAREAFLVAVDSATHNPDAAVCAYMYVGRLQIEEGKFQSAVSSMMRALALCKGTELEPHAAMLLSSAYLMAGSPEGATSILMRRREDLQNHEQQSAAAFLSALSRFQSAILPGPKERAGRGLVTALTRFRPGQQFGAHWLYLHAQACEDLGLTQQAINGFTETIKRLPAAALRQQAMIKLAQQYRYDQRLSEASLLLAGVSADGDDKLGQRITLQAALVALDQGDSLTTIKHCRQLVRVADDGEMQKAAMQLMGRAYEHQRDHQAAVYCFAGMLPKDEAFPSTLIPAENEKEPTVAPDSAITPEPSITPTYAEDEPSQPKRTIEQTVFLKAVPVEIPDTQWRAQ